MITAALVARGLCMLQREQQHLNQVERRIHSHPSRFAADDAVICRLTRDGLRIRAREGAALLTMLTAANDGASVPAKA